MEADGGQHSESTKDARRDEFLAVQGWLVLRLWNNEILHNIDGVIAVIEAACRQRALVAPPPSLPRAAHGGGALGIS